MADCAADLLQNRQDFVQHPILRHLFLAVKDADGRYDFSAPVIDGNGDTPIPLFAFTVIDRVALCPDLHQFRFQGGMAGVGFSVRDSSGFGPR